MKISKAQSIYQTNRQKLIERTKELMKQREQAQLKYNATGASQFLEQAATLELSIQDTQKEFHKNQEVLDSLAEQYAAAWNAEVARQQADPESGMGAEYAKIMMVAQRISRGDKVPLTDEKKLMEYNTKLYQMAKNAQMLHEMEEHKEHDSLWKDSKEAAEKYDPEGKAEEALAQGELPEISEISEEML